MLSCVNKRLSKIKVTVWSKNTFQEYNWTRRSIICHFQENMFLAAVFAAAAAAAVDVRFMFNVLLITVVW